jgi:hypothetical protein
MARTIADFWKLLSEIQGETTDLTDSVKAIAQNEKTVSENLFKNVIDQACYTSQDYERIRSFLRDWYATHRSLISYQANISDIYQMPNDQLDDLFQSFGYNLSASLKNPTGNDATIDKVNFFLDLVNLYKIKGTPQALLDVLRYYGLVDVDLFEMSLQFDDRDGKPDDDLIFKGKVVSGTTGDNTPVYLPFDLLTNADPHWFQTESEIKTLFNQTDINFPSQSPYFAVKPLFDEEATDAATGMLQRRVQDQYDVWETNAFPPEDTNPVLPQDAIITITGDQCSLLTLYLSCIYIFNREYSVGTPFPLPPNYRFICYDGTNTASADILDEFRDITSKPLSRLDQKIRYAEYLDTFSREISLNFLQDQNDAGIILATLNPSVKANLDTLATDLNSILGTLLRDLGEWVRANISYGFINMSYILFGIDSLFSQLRDVIEFFKPYRARLVPLETIMFRNRLFNTVIVEDSFDIRLDFYMHDYLVGNSIPCCSDSTCTGLYHSREYYDCGSYHDIGAVVDKNRVEIDIVQSFADYMKCPYSDTTGYVESEIISGNYVTPQSVNIPTGTRLMSVDFEVSQPTSDYVLECNIFNETDTIPSIIPYVIKQKTNLGFTVEFSDTFDTENYYLTYDIADQTNTFGIEVIPNGVDELYVAFPTARLNPFYSLTMGIENLVDATSSFFLYTITEKTQNGFKVKFSGNINSPNYTLAWTTYDYGRITQTSYIQNGWNQIPNGVSLFTIPFDDSPEIFDNYNLTISIVNTDDTSVSNYGYVVTSKDIYGFTVQLTSPTTSPNYYISWALPVSSSRIFENFLYRQTSQMRDYDSEGTFDCVYTMEQVLIQVEDAINFLLQENGDYLLLEDGYRIRI